MAIKFFITDVDGTLLTSTHQLSDKNIQAIAKLNQQQITTVIATGRPYSWIKEYILKYVPFELVITVNGAMIHKHGKRDDQHLQLFSRQLTEDIADLVTKFNDQLKIRYIDANEVDNKDEVVCMDVDIADEIDYQGYELEALINKTFPQVVACHIPDKLIGCVQINLKNVNKQIAIAYLAKTYHVQPHEILYCGDNTNDLVVFQWLQANQGYGIAVQNALPIIKANAYATIEADYESSAIAVIIDKYIDNNI